MLHVRLGCLTGIATFKLSGSIPQEMDSGCPRGRAFCAQCGTSLLFASDAHPEELDLSVGSLDAPDSCPPTCHIFVPDKVAWVALEPGLPRHTGDSSSPRLS
jgi:hypothetical protein